MRTSGGLAGAVGPQEPVDLALGDPQVEPVDRPDAALEGADEAVGLDRGGRAQRDPSQAACSRPSAVRGGRPPRSSSPSARQSQAARRSAQTE